MSQNIDRLFEALGIAGFYVTGLYQQQNVYGYVPPTHKWRANIHSKGSLSTLKAEFGHGDTIYDAFVDAMQKLDIPIEPAQKLTLEDLL